MIIMTRQCRSKIASLLFGGLLNSELASLARTEISSGVCEVGKMEWDGGWEKGRGE